MTEKVHRLASIDVLRALTMLLMIFVNDLWSLKGVPEWLEHTEAKEDGMGLADVVFPAFLFIVGLSIPHSINARSKKGFSKNSTFWHILLRSAALITMGVLHVNLGSYSDEAMIPKNIWQILITVSFFLIWLDYSPSWPKMKKNIFQGSGLLLLVLLMFLYKGSENGSEVWLRTQWWGILGLIGWTYFISSTLALVFNQKIIPLVFFLLIFLILSSATHAKWDFYNEHLSSFFDLPVDAGLPVLTITGTIISLLYTRYKNTNQVKKFFIISLMIAILMSAAGFLTRPVWGISKILATPSWILICTAITLIVFLFMIWLCDIRQKTNWFKIIRPAGTSTLTAYLLPYIHYAFLSMSGIFLPVMLRTGGIGIIKSLTYALLIILCTGILEKYRLRLKL